MQKIIKSALAILLFVSTYAFAVEALKGNPQEVIEQATNGVASQLAKVAKEDRSDEMIRDLVLNSIIPAVDQRRFAMGALGKHWRTASPEQRQAFIERYRDLQIRIYSKAFKAFSGEHFVVEDVSYNDSKDKAIVKGNLIQADGRPIPIQFRMYQNDSNSPWLIYDAVVSGLSMMKTYRDQLNERLQKISLNELLDELSEQLNN